MLTAKQEQFVKNIIDGMSQAEAFRNSYETKRMSDKTVYEKASRLMADGKIRARLRELRDQMMKPSIMTAQERLEYLTRVINGTEPEKELHLVNGEEIEINVPASIKTKLSAIDIMNKMQGEYVTKVEGSLNVSKLEDLL